MHNKSTHRMNREGLTRLWELGAGRGPADGEIDQDELTAELLRAKLDGALPLDEAAVDSVPVILARPCPELLCCTGRTLRDVLLDPKAGLDAIKTVKDYAKKLAGRDELEPEHAVAIAIYYAAIAGAQVFHGHKITSHSQEYLHRSYGELTEAPWMPADLGGLLTKARELCRKPPG